MLLWSAVLAVLWIASGVVEGNARVGFWAVAVAIDYIVIWIGFPFPGLGYTRTVEWSIAGEHLAERYELFIILAPGESILITGATYGEIPRSAETVAAFIVAFIGSVALWWLYFARGAMAGREAIAHTVDPGMLGLIAYSYFHLPMVAGIVMSAGADEMTIAHSLEGPAPAMTAMILGGPALYLIGNAMFTWSHSGRVAWSRLIAVAVLASLAPMSGGAPTLALQIAATLALLALVVWDVSSVSRLQDRRETLHADMVERGGRSH